MVTMFSLFAEIERDLISERTKEGIARAKKKGARLGRPKGSKRSKLDKHDGEIKKLAAKGVSRTAMAQIFDVSWPAIDHYLKTREISIEKS